MPDQNEPISEPRRRETDPDGDDIAFVPSPDYDVDLVEYRTLRRANYCCEACSTRVELGEGLIWKIRSNDFSYRNTAYVCVECLHRQGWRDDVRKRRIQEAGPVKGRLIGWFWDAPTAFIRYAEHVLIGLVLLSTLLLLVTAIGAQEYFLNAVVQSSGLVIGITAGLYLCHLVVWVYRDPRGWVFSRRPPWYYLLIICGFGSIAYFLTLAIDDVSSLVSTAILVGTGVGCAIAIDQSVRRDRTQYYFPGAPMYRAIVVGTVRISAFLSVVITVAPQALWGSSTLSAVSYGMPIIVSGGYLVYRSTKDPVVRDSFVHMYDYIEHPVQRVYTKLIPSSSEVTQQQEPLAGEREAENSSNQQRGSSDQ
ncbi:hypothetical protein [Halomarina litorea]|uniref:hypothetical protein n=1 Tax=Halomarina litorea TaxID=2961595 RepID=UPI0020C4835A|nr:hypothetical protein [Halomarina sp. BCD28]